MTAGATSSAAAGQQQQQPDSTSFVSLTELKELCSKALSTIGYSKDEVAVLLEVGEPAVKPQAYLHGSNCTSLAQLLWQQRVHTTCVEPPD